MLDLMKMEQTNTTTKVSRKIKRRLQGSSDIAPSTSSSAVDVVKISMSVDSSGRVKKVVRRTPRTEASSVPGSSNGQGIFQCCVNLILNNRFNEPYHVKLINWSLSFMSIPIIKGNVVTPAISTISSTVTTTTTSSSESNMELSSTATSSEGY